MKIYEPDKKTYQLFTVVGILLLCGLICAAYINFNYDFGFWYRLPSYVLGPLCLVSGFVIATRYMLFSFECAIYGKYDFPANTLVVARYLVNSKKVTCALPFDSLIAILTKKEYKAYKKENKIKHKYNYCTNLLVNRPYYVIYNCGQYKKSFVIEIPKQLYKEIDEICKSNGILQQNP